MLLMFVVSVTLAGCRREAASETPATAEREPAGETAPSKVPMSTRRACTGDGSYEKAVDCFRKAAVLKFSLPEGMGTLSRDERDRERLVLLIAKGGEKGNWFAEEQSTGVVWSRDGQKLTAVPPRMEKLYQRVTIFPDPQKKEGKPALVSRDEKAVTYEFSDANSGEKYTVRVDPRFGTIRDFEIGDLSLNFAADGPDTAAPDAAASSTAAAAGGTAQATAKSGTATTTTAAKP